MGINFCIHDLYIIPAVKVENEQIKTTEKALTKFKLPPRTALLRNINTDISLTTKGADSSIGLSSVVFMFTSNVAYRPNSKVLLGPCHTIGLYYKYAKKSWIWIQRTPKI